MWVVADHSNHSVYIFDSQDQVVRKFGSKGNGSGQFDKPARLAFDADNHCMWYVDSITKYKSLVSMVNSNSSLVTWKQAMVNWIVH